MSEEAPPKQSVSRNAAYLTVAYVIQKILTLGYFVVIARVYGPAEQGQYSAALAFAALFAVMIDLGFASVLTREVAQDSSKLSKLLSQVLLVRICLGIVMYGLMIGTAFVLGYSPEIITILYVAALATLFDMLSTSFWAAWRGLHDLSHEARGVVLATGIMVGGGIFAVVLGLPIVYLAVALLCASIANAGYGLWLLLVRAKIRLSWSLDLRLLRDIATIALPFAVAAVFSRIYTFADVGMVARISGDEAAGWYSAANKIILALQFMPAALSASIFPAMSAYYAKDVSLVTPTFFRAFRYLLILVVPMAVGLAVLARPLVETFYGVAYAPAAVMMQMLAPALLGAFLIFPFGALMAAIGRQKENMLIFASAAILNIAGNFWLIPAYGGVGAAAVSSVTYLWILCLELIMTRHVLRAVIRDMLLASLRVFSAAGIMGFVVFEAARAISVIPAVLVGVVTYGVLMVLLRGITLAELREMRDILAMQKKVA